MQNWERSEFDEQWKDAFAGAEVAPSASVWANVDRDLTLVDNNEGKRRIIFYQRLAAACVLFALAAGGFGIYHWNQSEIRVARLNSEKPNNATSQGDSQTAGQNKSPQSQTAGAADSLAEERTKESNPRELDEPKSLVSSQTNERNVSSNDSKSTGDKVAKLNSEKPTDVAAQSRALNEKNVSPQSHTDVGNSIAKNRIVGKVESSSSTRDQNSANDVAGAISPQEKITKNQNNIAISVLEKEDSHQGKSWFATSIELPSPELLPIANVQGEPRFAEIYRKLPYIPGAFMNESRKQKFEHEKLWASVTAGSGTYTESSGSSYNSYAATRVYNAASFQSSTPGSTLANNATGTVPTVGKSYSYGVLGGVRLAERWVLQTGVQYMSQSIGNSSPYSNFSGGSLTSTNEFVSVPVQAGYLLINQKIGWQLNPGLSTDFFVLNTTGNQQASVTQGAGADSPYRSVNFAGLMSSEFSYKLGKNYRLSLVPGMRYSFNPALKSMTTGSAMTWDVGFRFRYIFK